jgi:hypothetical protein
MKKVLIVLLLLNIFVYASSDNKYSYEPKASTDFLLTKTVRVLKNFYVNVDFVRMLTLVDNRFENDDFLNAPKRIMSEKPVCMLVYKF